MFILKSKYDELLVKHDFWKEQAIEWEKKHKDICDAKKAEIHHYEVLLRGACPQQIFASRFHFTEDGFLVFRVSDEAVALFKKEDIEGIINLNLHEKAKEEQILGEQ